VPFYAQREWVEADRSQGFRIEAERERAVLVVSYDIVTYRHAETGEVRHTRRRRHFREWYDRSSREAWPAFVERARRSSGGWTLATEEELDDDADTALTSDGRPRFRAAVMGEPERAVSREVFA